MIGDFRVLIALVIAIPSVAWLAWLASEFQGRRWLRVVLGTVAILSSLLMAVLVGGAEHFNANAWYGSAAACFVNATVAELEAGNVDGVLQSLKVMQQEFRPTYEDRARFDILCDQAVARMKTRPGAAP
jgi:hypothetical protein